MKENTPRVPSLLLLAIAVALSLLTGWRPLLATFALAWRDESYTHILLILPVVTALIYLDRSFFRMTPELDLKRGSLLLALGLLTAIWLRYRASSLTSDVWLSIVILGLVVSWIGGFVLSYGARISRALLFPLLLLFGLVPIPRFIVAELVSWLQHGSAFSARAFFAAAGVPVAQNGFLLTIPGLTIEVAKECSSIRSSSMLLLTSMVLAQVILNSQWRKTLAIALVIPLSIAKNGLRIFTIVMLGTRVNPIFLTGPFHHQGGIIFFLVSLSAMCAVIWVLKRGEDSSRSVPENALSRESRLPAHETSLAK